MSDAQSWAAATLKSAAGVAPDPQQWPGALPYAHGALPGPNKMRLQELSFADPPSLTRTKGSTFKGSAFNRRATAARELLGAVEVAELTVLTARRQQQQQYQQQQYEQATATFAAVFGMVCARASSESPPRVANPLPCDDAIADG